MNPQNTIILGDGYVSRAYQRKGYKCIDRTQFYFEPHNFDVLIPLIKGYSYIINCIAKTDTKWCENSSNFKQLWQTNVLFVDYLAQYCVTNGIKLIHISTTDLYGNSHEWAENTEDCRKLDLNTDYRLTKYAGERVCGPNALILRIRLPFDDTDHPKNLLVKIQKFTKFFHLATDVTYLPDLVCATEVIYDRTGIFNVVSTTDTSIFYIAKNLLALPVTKNMDSHVPDENIITEFDNFYVNNLANTDKISKFYIMSELDSTIINAYNSLTTNQKPV